MSGEVTRRRNGNDSQVRPTWAYTGSDNHLEMFESIRNVMEGVYRSQMLQCDVAHAIKDMAKTLRRIDRRLAKVEKLK